MIRLAAPDFGDEDLRLVGEVLKSGQLVQGRMVERFEGLVAQRVGAAHAIAVTSGTAALHLALLALGVGPGDEVIVPDYTFPATANAVRNVGAEPVLVDVQLESFNIAPERIEAALSPRTRAILPVHLFGLPAEMDAIRSIASSLDLAILEDAACALGATYGGRPCGTLGDAGCFSFHPRKIVTTGEGGMITTQDRTLAERLRRLRDHGLERTASGARLVAAGLNYRMTEMQAALGVSQMARLDGFLARRRAIAERYHQSLSSLRWLSLPPRPTSGAEHAFQSFVVLVDRARHRDRLIAGLRERGVEAAIGTYALSREPLYARPAEGFPGSRAAFEQALALPIHPGLSDADVDLVANALTAELVREQS